VFALGGCILRDIRLAGYKIAEIPAWSRILDETSQIFQSDNSDIPLETRYQAAAAYGLGGDDRLRDFDQTWELIPKGTFNMGAQSFDPKV